VRDWAIANGGREKLRICLAGFDGEHSMPSEWECVAWKANGGYGNSKTKGAYDRTRERLWFSPGCLRGNEDRR
jgi:hypothetical protein